MADRLSDDLSQRMAGGDQDLALHQIDPGNGFRDRVLHLNARIHLDEVQIAGFVHQELDGSGVGVADVAHGVAQAADHLLAQLRGHGGRRRLLQQLLVAALDGAFALAQDLDVPVLVGQHLELDVARRFDQFLHVNVGRSEGGLRFLLGLGEKRGEFGRLAHHAHSTATAAGGGFQHHRVADALGGFESFFRSFQDPVRAGQDGDAAFPHGGAGVLLQSHGARDVGLGSDELDLGCLADLGEVGILAQETVAGMDRVDVGDLGGADHRRNVEIAARAFGRADANGFVGEAHVQAVAVGLRIHGDGLDPEILAGADDAHGDLAAIGDEDFLEHISAAGWRTALLRTRPGGRSP